MLKVTSALQCSEGRTSFRKEMGSVMLFPSDVGVKQAVVQGNRCVKCSRVLSRFTRRRVLVSLEVKFTHETVENSPRVVAQSPLRCQSAIPSKISQAI